MESDSNNAGAFSVIVIVFKVAKHSFLVPIRYSSLFSNHWQLDSQNWQDASSTKIDCIVIRFVGLSSFAMTTRLVINQH